MKSLSICLTMAVNQLDTVFKNFKKYQLHIWCFNPCCRNLPRRICFLFIWTEKKNFTAPFYGWGSTASRREPLWGGSLLFNTKFPEIFGTHFYRLRNDERLSRPWSYLVVLSMGPMNWESSALTSRPTSFTVNIVFLVFYEGFSHYYWFFLWSFNFSGFSWWLCVTFVLLVVEINIRISCFKLYFQDT